MKGIVLTVFDAFKAGNDAILTAVRKVTQETDKIRCSRYLCNASNSRNLLRCPGHTGDREYTPYNCE